MKGARHAIALALALSVVGCSSQSPRSMSDQVAHLLAERGIPADRVVLPFALSPEMKEWLLARVPRAGDPLVRLDRLLRSLLSSDGVELVYDRAFTGTAPEVFAEKRANCLAFTHLFVGMAREVGLPVYFLKVKDLASFSKQGDLIIASSHVTSGFGPPNDRRILDFSDQPVSEYRQIVQISDLTAVAMFHSNRGAEMLRDGKLPEAVKWLETATALDPEMAGGWINYGVALRRSGQLRAAETAYRRALEADPTEVAAYQNLAALLDLLGRRDEAVALLGLVESLGTRNPFSYLSLGDLALNQGRRAEAERLYRRAARLAPAEAEIQAALGEWALAAGETAQARRLLKKASKIDPANERVRRLADRLGEKLPAPAGQRSS